MIWLFLLFVNSTLIRPTLIELFILDFFNFQKTGKEEEEEAKEAKDEKGGSNRRWRERLQLQTRRERRGKGGLWRYTYF